FELFFFSSRRRHTRSKRDWSSDVCSSDLTSQVATATAPATTRYQPQGLSTMPAITRRARPTPTPIAALRSRPALFFGLGIRTVQIGRASCRERGEGSADGV